MQLNDIHQVETKISFKAPGADDFGDFVQVPPAQKPWKISEWWFPMLGTIAWSGGSYNQTQLQVTGVMSPSVQDSLHAMPHVVSTSTIKDTENVEVIGALTAGEAYPYLYRFGFIKEDDIGNAADQIAVEDVAGRNARGGANTENDANIGPSIGFPSFVQRDERIAQYYR